MTTFDEARNQLRALMPLAHEGILAECWPIIDARIAELDAEVERLREENAALLRNSQAAVMATAVASQEEPDGR